MSSGQYPDRDAQLFYELARDRHAAQAETLNLLDSKLAFFLTSSSALLGILIAVYALRPDSFHAPGLALLSGSGLAWLVLTGFTLHAFRHRAWRSGPKLPEVFDLHFSENDERLKWRVANVFWHDYNYNKCHEKRKGRALTWALLLFVTQTVLLLVALLLVAVSGSSESLLTPVVASVVKLGDQGRYFGAVKKFRNVADDRATRYLSTCHGSYPSCGHAPGSSRFAGALFLWICRVILSRASDDKALFGGPRARFVRAGYRPSAVPPFALQIVAVEVLRASRDSASGGRELSRRAAKARIRSDCRRRDSNPQFPGGTASSQPVVRRSRS